MIEALTRAIGAIGLIAVAALTVPATAQEAHTVEFDGLIELRAVESDLDFDQGDDIDSSGIGARLRLGAEYRLAQKTEIRLEGEARIFDFRNEARDNQETVIGRATVTQQVTNEVEVRAHIRRFENIAVLEAFSADQTSVGGRVQWERGNDRIRFNVEYREREFDTAASGNSEGYQASAQYNRRFGSFHWVRFDLRHEDMQSDNDPRRSFDRQAARVTYSYPISRRVRLRPSIEYRQWDYETRLAQGDPDGELRSDSYVAPGLEVSVGRVTRGLYASASAEYRIKTSNDERFGQDAIRLAVRVGYRF